MSTKLTNKEKLIEAADDLFRVYGISGVTTKDITKKAGVSVGVFYNYFDSKEAIFIELINHFFEYSEKKLEEVRSNITGKNVKSEIKFKEYLIAGLEKNLENVHLNVDMNLIARKDKKFAETIDKYFTSMVDHIAQILKEVNPNFIELPLTEAQIITNMLQINSPSLEVFRNEKKKEEYINKLVNIVYDLSFGGL